MNKLLTLVLVHDIEKHRILLGMKKRGFGAGKWNGFGGKVEEGETILAAAHRELEEEAGITVSDIEEAGVFLFDGVPYPVPFEVHLFRARKWEGEPVETEEMMPQWFPEDALPFDAMWADDPHWMPLFLDGVPFTGRFTFDAEGAIVHSELLPQK